MRNLSIYIIVLAIFFMKGASASQVRNKTEIQQLFASYMSKYNHYLQPGELRHAPGL